MVNNMDKLKSILIGNENFEPEQIKIISDTVDLFKQSYGFNVIKNPAKDYQLFVRMWRAALVVKNNGELKSTNALLIHNPDKFWNIEHGSEERESVFEETSYINGSSSATIINDSIPKILVKNANKTNMQDYYGDALSKNIPEIIRDFNSLINAKIPDSALNSKLFKEGIEEMGMRANRSFTKEAEEDIAKVIKEEIDLWVDYIQNLTKEVEFNQETLDLLRRSKIPHIHAYNWLQAYDVKNNDIDIIKEKRMKFAKDWPMMISTACITKNMFDKIYIAIQNGDDAAPIIADIANVPVELVEKFRGISSEELNSEYDLGRQGFIEFLNNIHKSNNIENIPKTKKGWEKRSLLSSWNSRFKKLMNENFNLNIPNNISDTFDLNKIRKALEVLPVVMSDIEMLTCHIPKSTAIKLIKNSSKNNIQATERKLGQIAENSFNPKHASLAVILSKGSMENTVDFINNYYDKLMKNRSLFSKNIQPTYEDYRERKIATCTFWRSFSDRNKIPLPSGGYIDIIDNSYKLFELENKNNIPVVSQAYNFYDNTMQLMAFYNVGGECIGAATVYPNELYKMTKANFENYDEFLSNAHISDTPSFIKEIITPHGTYKPTQDLLNMIWEFDEEVKNLTIPVEYKDLVEEQNYRKKLFLSDTEVQTTPYVLTKDYRLIKDYISVYKASELPDILNYSSPNLIDSLKNMKEFISDAVHRVNNDIVDVSIKFEVIQKPVRSKNPSIGM